MFKYRRVLAFILDIIFVSTISMLLINNPKINPNYFIQEEYDKALMEKVEHIDYNFNPEEDTSVYIESMYNQVGVYMYDSIKSSLYAFTIFLIVNTLYFSVFAFCNDGKTLGCAVFKLKITKRDGTKAKIYNLAMRSLFMGSVIITYSPIASIIYIVLPRVLSPRQAFLPLTYSSLLIFVLESALLLFFALNKKDMTIQDYLSNTKILDTKK